MPQVGGAQIVVTVSVERTGLENDDVRRAHEAAVVVGDLAEIDRDVVAASFVVFLPVVAGVVQAERVDVVTVGIGLHHRARAHRETVTELDVRDLVDAGPKHSVEHVGLAQRSTVVQPHARRDETRRTFWCDGLDRSAGHAQCDGIGLCEGHWGCAETADYSGIESPLAQSVTYVVGIDS